MSPAKAQTCTAQSGFERTNHEATAQSSSSSRRSVKSVESVKAVESVKSLESVESAESAESVESVESVKSIQSLEGETNGIELGESVMVFPGMLLSRRFVRGCCVQRVDAITYSKKSGVQKFCRISSQRAPKGLWERKTGFFENSIVCRYWKCWSCFGHHPAGCNVLYLQEGSILNLVHLS